jgi:DNA polymerase I-like protein with 3'-5' exonuclease and polymerase domains
MSDYTVHIGIEHLSELDTCVSLAVDTETLQLQPEKGKLRLIQLGSLARKTIVLIDCFDLDDVGWGRLRHFFSNGERFWLAHNAVFDLGWLQEHNLHPRGRMRCSMIASKLLYNGMPNLKHSLAHVVQRVFKEDLDKEQQASDWGAPVLSQEQLEYAAKDVVALLELDAPLDHRLAEEGLSKAFALECRALPAMAAMWRTGLPWNADALQDLKEDYEFDIQELGKEFVWKLDEALPEDSKLPRLDDGSFNLNPRTEGSVRLGTKVYAGFNLNSTRQLIDKFTALLGEPPVDPKTERPSASRAALKNYAADHEVIAIYLAWKKAEKRRQMVESIQEKLGPDGFVRASYLQLGAETGRMSCIKPNNQQIPRDENFRACVEAPEGWVLIDADFGQMELRLAAAVAQDERMTKAFQDGEDLHTVTAAALGCDRQIAKSANFGLLYGSGAKGLRNYAGAMGVQITLDEAQTIRQQWLDTYYGIHEWQRSNALAADNTKGDPWAEVRIPVTGFRRFLPGDMNRLTVRCNTPIQGAGAAILKCALGGLWPHLLEAGEGIAKIAAVVHDEVVLLVREGYENRWAEILKDEMEKAESKWLGEIPALAEVHVGKTWSEVH